jgi:hypothetical protein
MKTEVRPTRSGVWAVGDRELTFPVRVRKAQMGASVYRAPSGAAREVLEGKPFEPIVVGRKAISLALFIRYIDGDLDAYDEFGVGLAVRGVGGKGFAVHVLHLPVTAEFTMHAGRGIWGLPKYVVQSGSAVEARQIRLELGEGSEHIVAGTIAAGLRLPLRATTESLGLSVGLQGQNEGRIVGTPSGMRVSNTRIGRTNSELVWGDHAMARDAMKLGMRGRPIASMLCDLEMSIGEPTVIDSATRRERR